MPMGVRAILFGSELVVFIVLWIFQINKKYRLEYSNHKNKVHTIKTVLIPHCILWLIEFAILGYIFLATFPTYRFLSYNKIILFTSFLLLFVFCSLIEIIDNKKVNDFLCKILLSLIIVFIVIAIMFMFGFTIENQIVIYKQEQCETISTPRMFEENQVGYTADLEGNIKTYMFYYWDNEKWNYVEENSRFVDRQTIENKDTYVVKTIETTSYCKQEKKHIEEDYILTKQEVRYKIYLNLNQMVEIAEN